MEVVEEVNNNNKQTVMYYSDYHGQLFKLIFACYINHLHGTACMCMACIVCIVVIVISMKLECYGIYTRIGTYLLLVFVLV